MPIRIINIATFVLVLLLSSCANPGYYHLSNDRPAQPAITGVVKLHNAIPFSKNAKLDYNAVTKCKPAEKLSAYIRKYAREQQIEVQRVSSVSPSDAGQVLIIEFTDIMSRGNALKGHKKYVEIKGTLFRDGTRVSTLYAARYSAGGLFSFFRSSCGVIDLTVEKVAEDTVDWMTNPIDRYYAGDVFGERQ